MKEVNFNQYLNETVEQLKKGAFLTVRSGDRVNTMTIGWGMLGVIWAKPVFQVLVRSSRYSFGLIENSNDFTVSIPLNKDMKKELAFCGTKSGKDVDKFEACNLSLVPGSKVESPIIGECTLHYECRIVTKQKLLPDQINEKERIAFYSNNDYHTMYYGEVVAVYMTE